VAIRYPERIGLWAATPLYSFYWLMYPAIWVLNASANGVLRLFRLNAAGGHDTHYSADELKLILRTSRTSSRFSADEWNVLAQTLDFGELNVSDLMRPIHEIAALYRGRSLEENLATVYRTRYSRYPYFAEDGIEVLGVIHLKDLFLAEQNSRKITDLTAFLRPVSHVTPRMPAIELMRRFRTGAPHFAVVGRKGEKPVGFLTLDNLLGALVGEIRDEFRQSDNDWTRLDDGTLMGKGSLPIFTLERALGIDVENEEVDLEEADSVGGLVMEKLGDIPREGQKIPFNQFDVVVKKMNGPRIVLLRVYPRRNALEETGV
jgi:CBS domain containing-hemolysin-like protein